MSEITKKSQIKNLSRSKLVGLVKNDMGYTDDDFDFKTLTKPELIEIAIDHMGPDLKAKGGISNGRAIMKKRGGTFKGTF
tara:strand:- start:7 stop:246 length:240 start_codon:yes stop_codon:yes gene_type:complete